MKMLISCDLNFDSSKGIWKKHTHFFLVKENIPVDRKSMCNVLLAFTLTFLSSVFQALFHSVYTALHLIPSLCFSSLPCTLRICFHLKYILPHLGLQKTFKYLKWHTATLLSLYAKTADLSHNKTWHWMPESPVQSSPDSASYDQRTAAS